MPARYRAVPSAKLADLRQSTPTVESVVETDEEVSYRDLQAQAKEAGIPANQSREDLEKALADA